MGTTEWAEYVPTKDALLLQLLDQRVANALVDENAHWNTAERRMDVIRQRCQRASEECDE